MAVPHDAVAHNWAHDTGRARRGFNMFWEGDGAGRTIFSYGHHFPIARFVEARDGAPVVLFTTDGYSVSTAKHKTITRRAIPAGVPVFDVSDVMAKTESACRSNWDSMVGEMRQCVAKAARARIYGASWLDQADRWQRKANHYAEAFGLDVAPVEAVELSPEALERIKAAEAEERRREAERTREAVSAWQRGERATCPHTRVAHVRIEHDGTVSTSYGIRGLPLRACLAVLRLARHCKAKGVAFEPLKVHTVGSWSVDRIGADGSIRAGCHVIPLASTAAALEAWQARESRGVAA